MSGQWTINRICEGLGGGPAAARFLEDITTATEADLLTVFARWRRIAEDTVAAVARSREIHEALERGETIPGEIVGTSRLQAAADRFRSQGAA
ncbi:hypothetical protein [Streptomyces clavuligerus]|uniref:hypothetical protein n=1 Tax=Streptomyces clavuligerus TaxID=1901 RepID=UPI00018004BF|nr:hypothetical protein [Streptomyces clavuligerus]EDY52259.1 hypothetical protein SSCG_05253 [Streptomyces clavuligerus]WDN56058.1 hypothetical protein LL058_29720 [Streptomyces clavuligerus]